MKGSLTAEEITKAEAYWVREAQKVFAPFLKNRVNTRRREYQLYGKEVYLDDANIITHKGRLQYSSLRNRIKSCSQKIHDLPSF